MKQKCFAALLSVFMLLGLASCAQEARGSGIGDFKTVTVTGEEIDQSIFSDAELTMINVWATWCGPCIRELPDLGALSDELAGTGAQIIGIVHDTADENGSVDETARGVAEIILERTGVAYPCLIPDSHLAEGLLQEITAFPTTWFVDSKGSLVGEPVVGAHSKEEWESMIQERLAEAAP